MSAAGPFAGQSDATERKRGRTHRWRRWGRRSGRWSTVKYINRCVTSRCGYKSRGPPLLPATRCGCTLMSVLHTRRCRCASFPGASASNDRKADRARCSRDSRMVKYRTNSLESSNENQLHVSYNAWAKYDKSVHVTHCKSWNLIIILDQSTLHENTKLLTR